VERVSDLIAMPVAHGKQRIRNCRFEHPAGFYDSILLECCKKADIDLHEAR
jgi:hypothetical protein